MFTRIAWQPSAAAASTHFLWFSTAFIALVLVRAGEVALAVDHDQHAGHALVVGPLLQLFQVLLVLGLVLEELVDELDALDPELLAGHLGEVQIHLGGLRPIGEKLSCAATTRPARS